MSTTSKNDDNENKVVLEALERLQGSLQELPDQQNAPHLSHWRVLPESLAESYNYITRGAELVKATSTKYTLVGKIDATQGSQLAKELLKGCEWISTGVLVLCQDDSGCAKSTRHLANHAARAVIHTTMALVDLFQQCHEHDTDNIAAQKTGAVWSTCDTLLKIPQGNRNAIRREMFTYIVECKETWHEFDTMIQRGPTSTIPLDTIQEDDKNENEEETWDDFENDDQYTELELPVATASLGLIKCSSRSLQVTLEACEAIGTVIDANVDNNSTILLDYIQEFTSLARIVGDQMTNLGTCLYPPLEYSHAGDDSLQNRLLQQRNAILALHDYILDAPTDLPEGVTELASKLKNAANTRYQEAMNAINGAAGATVRNGDM